MNKSVVSYGGSMSDKDPSDACPPHPSRPRLWGHYSAHIRQAAAADSSELHRGPGRDKMCAAIPGLSGFPTLLLSLLLFRPGLQVAGQQHRNANVTLFNGTIRELQRELEPAPADPDIEDRILLCEPSLWRKNLCAFLNAMNSSSATHTMKKNLESLKKYVPEPRTPPMKNPVTIKDWNDFRKKLNYYLEKIFCEASTSTRGTSIPPPCRFVPVFSPVDWDC